MKNKEKLCTELAIFFSYPDDALSEVLKLFDFFFTEIYLFFWTSVEIYQRDVLEMEYGIRMDEGFGLASHLLL